MYILFPSDPSQYDARDVVTTKKNLWYCSQFMKQARGNEELAFERMVGSTAVSRVVCVCSVHSCVC